MKEKNTALKRKLEKRKNRNRFLAGILAILLILAMVLSIIVPFLV